MTGKFRIANAALVLLLTSSWLVKAQDVVNPRQTGDLRVEVETNKGTYALGEPIRFTATQRNRGATALYISKSFSQAGGGIAGFYVSVKQLTGKPAGGACEGNGDRYMDKDSRTPEQILREDYLALPSGAMVGFEAQYRGCVVQNPGAYQITATYSAQDLNVSRVRSVAGKADQIVTGQSHSEPSTFHVR